MNLRFKICLYLAVLTGLLLGGGLGPSPLEAQQLQRPATVRPAAVPTPESVLGFGVGEDGQLADWAQITDYFARVEAASPRVRVEGMGESVLGRPMILAVITSEANQARLEQIRGDQAKVADPREIAPAELERLIGEQPAVVFIGASLHGNEIMATQMAMELAYLLATDTEYERALEDVVVLLVPGMNPDGLDITRDWFLRTRQTAHAEAPMPWLYHHYTGHDNNRDFFMITQPETRAISRVLYERWFPHVVWDVHQMGNRGERFFIPPFADPLNPNLDPLLVRLTNLVGVQMAADMTAAGLSSISHRERFDLWWHGGARTVPARHNMIGILSEAASVLYADPIYQHPDSLEQPEVGSMYPDAWPGGWWRARDIVNYELEAARSLVMLLHRQRDRFVRDKIQLAQRQIDSGAEGAPFAYIVPIEQRDPGSAVELLHVLRRGGVEVHEARSVFQVAGRSYPIGTRLVLMAQPYRAHAKDLLEVQRYPDRRRGAGGPPAAPYDLAGWTLPLQMGVELHEVAEPFDTRALVRLDSVPVRPGTLSGEPGALAYALDSRMNAAHRAVHEVLRDGGQVNFASAPIPAGGAEWPVGAPLVWGVPELRQRVERWAREWGLHAHGLDQLPHEGFASLRVGLYKPRTASIDEGWTRWVFEQWGVPFDTILDPTIRAGGLNQRFDAIVVPAISHRDLVQGHPRAHPDFAGGLGSQGVVALREFVQRGGTLVLLDASVELAIRDLGVRVRDVVAAQDTTDAAARWFAPGSLLRVQWDTSHPVAAGMPDESAIFYARSPVLEVLPNARDVTVIARYPERHLLLSGYAQGEDRIAGHAAAVEARVGNGRVVMFAFRPQHRAQPHQTFKVLFNALYRGFDSAQPSATVGAPATLSVVP
jgi:hypothetical protein